MTPRGISITICACDARSTQWRDLLFAVRSTTSAGAGPSVGKHLLMAYLPMDVAEVGTRLLVENFGERYPVTVAVAGSAPLFDPENTRIRR